MATASEIEEVRNNTNTTDSDYSDTVIGNLIDASTVECASATIWKWELSKLGADSAKNIKKSSSGIESHEFNSIKDQMEYYQNMYKFYKQECEESQGAGISTWAKATPPSVGGVLTQDELDELADY